ncbi:MAG: hypothetical protein JW928_00290 [Candidatus Aureabacteria bacterium]|nr:hypothetical protein [Candidatus Auribacterota bacterium]
MLNSEILYLIGKQLDEKDVYDFTIVEECLESGNKLFIVKGSSVADNSRVHLTYTESHLEEFRDKELHDGGGFEVFKKRLKKEKDRLEEMNRSMKEENNKLKTILKEMNELLMKVESLNGGKIKPKEKE